MLEWGLLLVIGFVSGWYHGVGRGIAIGRQKAMKDCFNFLHENKLDQKGQSDGEY